MPQMAGGMKRKFDFRKISFLNNGFSSNKISNVSSIASLKQEYKGFLEVEKEELHQKAEESCGDKNSPFKFPFS